MRLLGTTAARSTLARLAFLLLVSAISGAAGCGGGDDTTDTGGDVAPVFPEDYAATYREVRNCRFSLEHDLMHVRVLASPEAFTPYSGRVEAFPPGAVVLKEEYGMDDTDCTGPIVTTTVMQKLDLGSMVTDLVWTWQEVTPAHHALPTTPKCVQCHKDCGKAPDGYDGTCEVP